MSEKFQAEEIEYVYDYKRIFSESEKAMQALGEAYDRKKAKENIINPISAYEIISTDWDEPEFIIPKYLPIGLTILAGRPKIGKSWLALQIATAVGGGGNVFGETVEQKKVLYIAYEDPARRLKERLKMQNTICDTNLLINFFPMDIAFEEFHDLRKSDGEKIATLIEEDEYGLVVIDTLSRGIHGDYNNNDFITKALTPMQTMAHDLNTGIIFIDHFRKSFKDKPDSILDIIGGTAKGAMIDTVWGIYKDRDIYKLEIIGRDIEHNLIQVEFDKDHCIWTLSGENSSNNIHGSKEAILELLENKGPLPNIQIAEIIGRDKANVHKDLLELLNDELVLRDKTREPYLYSINKS